MTFAIVADLPLGTYRGNGQDGRPERLPSVARLHSALLSAAGFGPRAVPREADGLGPCEADEAALRWLEENPPDGVRIPPLDFSIGRAVAYRDDGTLKKTHSSTTIKKLPKVPDACSAVSGRFVWLWRQPPPAPVREAFEALCPDVPYLGTTESPVRLAVLDQDVETNYERDPEAGLFAVGTLAIETPLPGRLAELAATHEAGSAVPSAARDRVGTDEKSLSPVPPREAVGTVQYRGVTGAPTDVPWAEVVLVPMSRAVPAKERVAWAVAAHRALIRLIGDGAPPLITGAYPDGAHRPANRLALHFLGRDAPVEGGGAGAPATLAVLVPSAADPDELGVLFTALSALTSLRGPRGQHARLEPEKMQIVPGGRFWHPPAPGTVRLWRTDPAAVPDTRGARDGAEWTFTHAGMLSLAFTCKDQLPGVPGRGDVYYRAMAAAVADRGAAVVHVSAVRSNDVNRYVHRIHENAVIRPYRAVIWLGDLTGPRTILAIGQSRHLGGGLLVPLDVTEGRSPSDVDLLGASEVTM